jgi:SAM-dependent methyltransferase
MTQIARLSFEAEGVSARLRIEAVPVSATLDSEPVAPTHDRARVHLLPPSAPWLRALGVTQPNGQPREGMAGKFRQIEKFAEVLRGLVDEAGLGGDRRFRLVDMGCGKGYLTFAASALLGERAMVCGVELRPALVDAANRLAESEGFTSLRFVAGSIADAPLDGAEAVVALHACDTATDDALARGVTAGASLLVVSPCCHREVRPQLAPPEPLATALLPGIFREREAEFVTDALRAALLECAGYRIKVFEFVSPEHTAKNLMIAAIATSSRDAPAAHERVRALAHFYGVRSQHLAARLGIALA